MTPPLPRPCSSLSSATTRAGAPLHRPATTRAAFHRHSRARCHPPIPSLRYRPDRQATLGRCSANRAECWAIVELRGGGSDGQVPGAKGECCGSCTASRMWSTQRRMPESQAVTKAVPARGLAARQADPSCAVCICGCVCGWAKPPPLSQPSRSDQDARWCRRSKSVLRCH
eukprot:2625874-Prymnesium_polylepis.2